MEEKNPTPQNEKPEKQEDKTEKLFDFNMGLRPVEVEDLFPSGFGNFGF